MRLVLFEPDIPQNTGALLRSRRLLESRRRRDFPLRLHLRRSSHEAGRHGLPGRGRAITRHNSWAAYRAWRVEQRRTGRPASLLSTKAAAPYHDFAYRADDSVMVGRESSGVPEDVHLAADHRLVIPLRAGMRSLNVAIAAAIVTAEALRQTGFSSLS